jgi:hypothetical protein
MYNSTRDFLINWNKANDERTKLQHAYMIIVAAAVVLAGLVSLLNPYYGQMLLQFAILVAGLFLVNALAWAVLQTFILHKLPKNLPRTRK